jgi:trk system potassium uptake protein TrkH
MPEARRHRFLRDKATGGVGEWLRALIAAAAFAPVVIDLGWPVESRPIDDSVLRALQSLLLAAYIATILLFPLGRPRTSRPRLSALIRRHRTELMVAGLTLLFAWVTHVANSGVTALMLLHLTRGYLRLTQTSIPPGALFVGSFAALVVIGTGALMLPAATPAGRPINILDAAFTITSAISQTGLVVRDTASGFTRFGHVIILIWIQVGALGILVFGALLANVIGSGFSLRATQSLAEPTEQGWTGALSLSRLVIFIIVVTHAFEAIGAAALYFSWPDSWDGAPDMHTRQDRLFHCVFFSISAFCGAGFVTTENSLVGLRDNWTSHGIIAPLIILGSIGFPVLDNLWRVAWAKIRRVRVHRGALIRLSLNTKIVLTTTLFVYVLGYAMIALGEFTQTAEPTRLILLDAHFMTVNRTSGFDTIPPADMGLLSRLTLILLMFIGGSPGSVAGGIKMMVFAVLILTVIATIFGRSETEAFGRTIPDSLVRKSATLIVLSLITLMAVTGVLAATETGRGDFTLGQLLFEATSAVGTVGLSMGVTPETSTPGRIALLIAMFVGRVGPLAALASLVAISRRSRARYSYPVEDVVIY